MPIINDENTEDQGNYYVTPTGITIGGRVKEYATYAEMLSDRNPGRYARVADASADPTVNSGAAIYRRTGTTWTKVYEEESMDLDAVTWDTLSGKPDKTAEQIEESVEKSHTHANKATLDKLGVNGDNKLTYDGVVVDSGTGTLDGDYVKTINSIAPDSNGNIAITIPDITGKQDNIYGTEGQIVVIGSNGRPEAQSIVLSHGTVTSVNNVSPDAAGNVTIDINDPNGVKYVTTMDVPSSSNLGKVVVYAGANGTYKTGGIYKVVGTTDPNTSTTTYSWSLVSVAGDVDFSVYALNADLAPVAEKAHTHNTQSSDNYDIINHLEACHPAEALFKSYEEVALPNTIETFTNAKANNTTYSFIGDDNQIYYINDASSKFGESTNTIIVNKSIASSGPSMENVTDHVIVGKQLAVINDGKLYVRGIGTSNSANNGNGAGSLMGDDLTINVSTWRQVGSDSDWTKIDGFINQWLFIKNGRLFTAGLNRCGLQSTAGLVGGNPDFSLNINTPTEIVVEENGQVLNDWISVDAGCHYSTAIRGSNGKRILYLWGSNADGTIGDGVRYTHDMVNVYAWENNNPGKYVKTGDSVYFTGKTYYSYNGSTYTAIDTTSLIGSDITGNNVYEIPLIIYTTSATPTAGSKAYIDIATRSVVGTIASTTSGSIVINGVTYTRSSGNDVNPDTIGQITPKPLAIDGVVIDDWDQVSAGYYHVVALRHVDGKSKVYVWGSNEYGNLGNGTYTDDSLIGGVLPEGVNTTIQLVARPHLLTTAEFPYEDVVKVQACHYGTFLTRANGEVYFAGCNKRNYFGTGTYVTTTSFVPKFTKLGERFTGATVLCETYGALLVTPIHKLKSTADDVVKATLTGTLSPEKLDQAVLQTHSHSVDTQMIDATSLLISQYASSLPETVLTRHSHSNLTDLNSITVRNGNLYLNGTLYAGGGNEGGTSIVIDPSNVQLDDLTDVTGLCNIAGGLGLEVISCNNYFVKVELTSNNIDNYVGKKYPLSANTSATSNYTYTEVLSTHVGRWIKTQAVIRCAPLGGTVPQYGRFVSLYYGTNKTAVPNLTAENQAKGLYGVPSNSASGKGYINCTKDLVTMMETVAKGSGSPTLTLYYVDAEHSANPATGTQFLQLTKSTISGYGTLYWQMDLGATIQANTEYYTTDKLPSVAVGYLQNEEEAFFDVYLSDGTFVHAKDDFEYVLTTDTTFQSGTTYYKKNGSSFSKATVTVGNAVTANTYYVKRYYVLEDNVTSVTDLGSIVNPVGKAYAWSYNNTTIYTESDTPVAGRTNYYNIPSFGAHTIVGTITSVASDHSSILINGNTYTRLDSADCDSYHTVFASTDANASTIISAENFKNGIYKKEANSLIRIKSYMKPEKFTSDLFKGSIYIHSGLSSYYGLANQVYTYGSSAANIAFINSSTADIDGNYPLESVVIVLNEAINNGDVNTEFTPSAGSINDPMYAVLYSKDRYATSTVTGEYNSAIGFNSEAGGIMNNAIGAYSVAKGFNNVASGDASIAAGSDNVVTGHHSVGIGKNNVVAGDQNICIGSANMSHGYYGFTFGDGNQLFGVGDIAIGAKNALYASMSGSIAIGRNNTIEEKARDSISVGNYITVSGERATAIGQYGTVNRFISMTDDTSTTFFPGEDTDILKSITTTSWKNSNYDNVFLSSKEGIFFCSGERKAVNGKPATNSIIPMYFTRYRVRPNVGYFGLAANASGRNTVDPYIFEPFMQWSVTGTMSMSFTDPQPKENDPTQFTFTKRYGGRLKSFDPGIELTTTPESLLFELNFDKATRWKIKANGETPTMLVPSNFEDGSEAYIILYAGANVTWDGFTILTIQLTNDNINEYVGGIYPTSTSINGTYSNATIASGDVGKFIKAPASEAEGTNVFDALIWANNGSAPVSSNLTNGFAVIKLVVIDNTCIAETIVNTLA